MSPFKIILAALSIAAFLPAKASAASRVEVLANIDKVALFKGSPDECHLTAVIRGVFPNGCYRWKEVRIDDASEYIHNVVGIATTATELMCTQALVPFQEPVQLGVLSKGTHLFRFFNSDGAYLEKAVESSELCQAL
jgi:hypothetical protein